MGITDSPWNIYGPPGPEESNMALDDSHLNVRSNDPCTPGSYLTPEAFEVKCANCGDRRSLHQTRDRLIHCMGNDSTFSPVIPVAPVEDGIDNHKEELMAAKPCPCKTCVEERQQLREQFNSQPRMGLTMPVAEAALTEADIEIDMHYEEIDHPPHYGGENNPYEVVKVCEAWGLDKDAYLFNVVKYIVRRNTKGDVLKDLRKAQWYLNRRIEQLTNHS